MLYKDVQYDYVQETYNMPDRRPIRSSSSGRHNKLFARRLHQLRVARGVSQEALAELAAVHRNYVGKLERGQQSPSLDTICRLAQALKVKPAALLANIS